MPVERDPSLVAARRPEHDLAARWGVYSAARDQWLDVCFTTKAEAEHAIAILNQSKGTRHRA